MANLQSLAGPHKGWQGMLLHAFGVKKDVLASKFESYVESNYESKRKVRSDKDKTVFNCEKKREITFNEFNTFKKLKNSEFRHTCFKLSNEEMQEEFNNLNEEQRHNLKMMSDRDKQESRSLWDRLANFM